MKPWASVIAIKNDKILFVGDEEEVEDFRENNTKVEELHGALVMPGIHDVHMVPLEASSPIGGDCHLNDVTEDIEELISEIEACDLQPNSNGWITSFGFSRFALLNEDLKNSPLDYLDDLFPNTPVVIMEQTSHAMWVNSQVL